MEHVAAVVPLRCGRLPPVAFAGVTSLFATWRLCQLDYHKRNQPCMTHWVQCPLSATASGKQASVASLDEKQATHKNVADVSIKSKAQTFICAPLESKAAVERKFVISSSEDVTSIMEFVAPLSERTSNKQLFCTSAGRFSC